MCDTPEPAEMKEGLSGPAVEARAAKQWDAPWARWVLGGKTRDLSARTPASPCACASDDNAAATRVPWYQ